MFVDTTSFKLPLLSLGRKGSPVTTNLREPTTNSMKTLSLKEFMQEKSFAQVIPVVRKNNNGYAFLTFTYADNKAENIYFSKSMSEVVKDVEKVDIAFLRGLKACETANADGELRWKLTDSAGNRVDMSAL